MTQWRYTRRVAAGLDFRRTPQGYIELDAPTPTYSIYGQLSEWGEEETKWQKEIREADLNGVGILGHSLDLIGFTASKAKIMFVDPITGHEIINPTFQRKIESVKWRNEKTFKEIIFSAVRYLSSVGEFELVQIGNEYDIFAVSQRVKTVENTYKDTAKTELLKEGYVEYRLREKYDKDRTIKVPLSKVERCFWSQPGSPNEAYTPARRVLPHIRLYMAIVRQFQRIAFANGLAQHIVYLGEDDGAWKRDQAYMSQWNDPSKAIPPAANDVIKTGKDIAKGQSTVPFYVTMGKVPPQKVDLTVSFDEQAREMLKDSEQAIASGLNIPARSLLPDSDNSHFVEADQEEKFRTLSVEPPLEIVLSFFFKSLFRKFAYEFNISADLGYSFQHLSKVTLNPSQMLEFFKIGAIGKKFIINQLGITEEEAALTTEDIQTRRELLTGDSGLQQAQLAERDRQKQGIELNAVQDIEPLPDGRARQSDTVSNAN